MMPGLFAHAPLEAPHTQVRNLLVEAFQDRVDRALDVQAGQTQQLTAHSR